MKSLMINSLVLAVALWTTPSLGATELSGQSEKDTHSVTSATATASLYALSRLEEQTLAAQEMTDQELKAVEGGWGVNIIGAVAMYYGTTCDSACQSAVSAVSIAATQMLK